MKLLTKLFLAVVFMACAQQTETIYEWRGPNRTGVYSETKLLGLWPPEGPGLIWETFDLGNGYGSPTVTDKRLLIVGSDDSLSYLFAFDFNGFLQYKKPIGAEWVVNYPGARCAPTVIGNKVYVMTGMGDVACLDEATGELLWKHNMVDDFGGVIPRFGFSQALAVKGDKVFCCPGGIQNNVMALNRFTGSTIWSCAGKGERPGYNPPKVIETEGRKIFVTFSAYHLLGVDVETGELLWSHEQINTPVENRGPGMGDTHANTVLFENDTLFYIEGDGNCAVALLLSHKGEKITQLWNNAVVDNYMGGILKIGDYLYSCGFSNKNLVKINAHNGAVEQSLPIGAGTLIAADGMLYYYTMQGIVNLISFKQNTMEVISSFKINKGSKEHFAHPVINNGSLYIRHGEYLGAYAIRN